MRRSWMAVPLALVALIALAQPALADQPAPAPSGSAAAAAAPAKTDSGVTAQELFDQAIQLMEQGKHAEACAKFEGSNKAAWAPGTTINLADCYEKVGKVASAWAKFLEAEPHFRNRTPPDKRADTAKERAEALYPKLPRLNLKVPAEAKVAGLIIKRDGETIDEIQWGTGLPVDPGKHVLEASAPGKEAWKWQGDVSEPGKTVEVSLPVLKDGPADVPPPGGESGMPVQKKIAIGVGAAGIVGLALGGVMGGLTLGKVGESNCTKIADGSFACDKAGFEARDAAKGLATVSTIGLIAGGVLAAGGVVLWLTAPSGAAAPKDAKDAPGAARVWIAPSFGGLAAGGQF